MRRDGVLALSSGGAATSAALLFGLFETMEWKMPTPLAVVLAVIFIGAIAIFVVLIAWEAPRLARTVLAKLGWRSPVFIKRPLPPDPNQWLIDQAREHARVPEDYLRVIGQFRSNQDFTDGLNRPWIELELHLLNVGLYPVKIGAISGRCRWNSQEIPDEAQYASGSTLLPHNRPISYVLRQYVDPQTAKEMFAKLREHPPYLIISLFTATLEITSEAPGAMARPWRLVGDDKFVIR